jgi:prepilin-type N-terminal cleavage/methylation domain-containing protein
MSRTQSGFTLIELLIAALILVTAVTVTIEVFGVNYKATSLSRNQLKAQTLATAKLDEFKDFARRYALSGAVPQTTTATFQSITLSAYAAACALTTNVARINDLNYNWSVTAGFAYQSGSIVADVTSNTVTTKLLKLTSYVRYYEGSDPRELTLTGYVADTSRYGP